MAVAVKNIRDCLKDFDFRRLFIEELGWSRPTSRQVTKIAVKDCPCIREEIAQLAGVSVFEIKTQRGQIPDAKARAAIQKEIASLHHENLLIFVDAQRTQSLWYWVKRQDGKTYPREHYYMKGQPGDLFISKINGIVFDISDFDVDGNIPVAQVAKRLKDALDVERVTKRFFSEFEKEHLAFTELIEGIPDERDRRWYASVMLNRLMFIYFLQRKFFIDGGNDQYLQARLAESQARGKDLYYRDFLRVLFFEGFAKPKEKRGKDEADRARINTLLGDIRYLNGGLFLPHRIEQKYPHIAMPDRAFENLLALFSRYSWNLNDTPGGDDHEINPDVLGYIFEKYINQKAFGAYYTRPEITEYLCQRTIHQLILDAVNVPPDAPILPGVKVRRYASMGDLLMDLDAPLCTRLLNEVLPNLSLLDPACGSGAFLVAAMKTLINVYSAVIGRIPFLHDDVLSAWLAKSQREHASIAYFIKKRIITDNLFGVDIMEEATEIARLRLFLTLVASADTVEQLEPLPHIDFNILCGNSLVGLTRVDDARFEARNKKGALGGLLFRQKSYQELLEEKNRDIATYRKATSYAEDLTALRDDINDRKRESISVLNELLLNEFHDMEIKYEQATWDAKKGCEGKPAKRSLKLSDVEALEPFHWGYEFDNILNERGGFDAILTNPPWEIFKPNGKEFFEQYSDQVSKKKMTIHEFEEKQAEILSDVPEVRAAWLNYLSSYPHVSAFYRAAPQYQNQISIVNGKKAGSDINLYKLFTEQCFNLLRPGGYCGIVIPSGIYTDLGSKQLRQMLFEQANITGLFCIENRKEVFENVHRSFKFVVLTFAKHRKTRSFPAAFMRLDVSELEHFPSQGAIDISVDLIKRLSPDSLSVMEFKNEVDVGIAEKLARFPMLGASTDTSWHFRLTNEFHMTGNHELFKTSPRPGRLPLFEGKMIHQFTHRYAEGRYWVDEKQGRAALLGRQDDQGQTLTYQCYRIAHRAIARNTDARTMIAAVLPPMTFFGHSLNATTQELEGAPLLLTLALLNSIVLDYQLRQSVSANLTMFFIYQLPVPRLTAKDVAFAPIVERAARLVCTTSEFDDLAKEVGLKSHKEGVTEAVERARLRAELDGLIAHVYGLTEDEFMHILGTFPLVPDPVKVAAHNAYRDVERGLIQ